MACEIGTPWAARSVRGGISSSQWKNSSNLHNSRSDKMRPRVSEPAWVLCPELHVISTSWGQTDFESSEFQHSESLGEQVGSLIVRSAMEIRYLSENSMKVCVYIIVFIRLNNLTRESAPMQIEFHSIRVRSAFLKQITCRRRQATRISDLRSATP